ncbi:MAG: Hit-like protein involved in cell-cycle regulation [Parcubacteria group bacterium Gr01-1014_70]|nr:MAG: Hit-like protein involved in cell-cycle regulation [Parcubacteria group bacterium Gr01-1014_70]
MEGNCIFCGIIKKTVPADIVSETNNLTVFRDIKPKAPVHLLIVPKKHVKSIAELGEDDQELVKDMIYTAKDTAREQGLSGYQLCFNVGRDGGQVVDHLHLHLLGGWKNKTDYNEVYM